MKTKHPIQLTQQELRDICEALARLLDNDYAALGRAQWSLLPGEQLAKIKDQLDRRISLRNRLSDQEFDLWKRELDDAHIHADAEEAARYAGAEPEIE